MASMRDIKRRRASIQSTGQITKAMKLVSTVKLQRAKQNAEKVRTYFTCMYETVQSLLLKSANVRSVFIQGNDSAEKAVILVTSNRGLAGGYNSNVVKLVQAMEDLKGAGLYAAGKKGKDALLKRGYSLKEDFSDCMESPVYADAQAIGKTVLSAFEQGRIGELWIAYTAFKGTMTHVPTLIKLLPVNPELDRNGERSSLEMFAPDGEKTDAQTVPMNFEPPVSEALPMLIPKYITSMIYGALMEAHASENAARMQAMDNATSNAEEMIDELGLQYNRARQGSITQELTEIIAGAEAIA